MTTTLLLLSMVAGMACANPETTFVLPGSAEIEMVWIEPGTFTMGTTEEQERLLRSKGMWASWFEHEHPAHQVTITRGFYLAKYEITQGQWEAVIGTRLWEGQRWVRESPNSAASYISWNDVQEFIAKLNQAEGSAVYRLPTEAEWEYSCRAGTTALWCFGDNELQLGQYAWYRVNAWTAGEKYAHAVGTKLPNPWGLYDMYGNVWEWVQDWYGSHSSRNRTDPTGLGTGSYRVVRGGYFRNTAGLARSASRSSQSTGYGNDTCGARLLRTGPARSPSTVSPPESSTNSDDLVFREAGEYDVEYARDNILPADLDNDGWVDILTIGGPVGGPYRLSVVLNNRDGTFAQGASYKASGPYMTCADFDGDGDVDVAAPTGPFSREEPYLTLFSNNGIGGFTQTERYPLKHRSTAVFSGDLDGNGNPDIAVAGEGRIDLFFNDGRGKFLARDAIDYAIGGEASILYYWLSGADFDGDNDLDLIHAAEGIGAIGGYFPGFHVHINEGRGMFSERVVYSHQNAKAPLILTEDFNGDGHTDVCALARFFNPSSFSPILPEKIFVFPNRGDGAFGELIEVLGGGIQEVSALSTETDIIPLFGVAGDINLDGHVDLVITSGPFDNAGQVYPFLNQGDGVFSESSGISAGGHPWLLALADLDNDGDLDLMITDQDVPVLKVFLNTTIESQPTGLGVEEDAVELPRMLRLEQNYPNPFNAETIIRYALPHPARVRLVIYNALGRHVQTLVDQEQVAGPYSVIWDGRDEVSTGTYFYRLEVDEECREVRRMLLLR